MKLDLFIEMNNFKLGRSSEEIEKIYAKKKQGIFDPIFVVIYNYMKDPRYPDHVPISDVRVPAQALLDNLRECVELIGIERPKFLWLPIDRIEAYLWLMGREDLMERSYHFSGSPVEHVVDLYEALKLNPPIELLRHMD